MTFTIRDTFGRPELMPEVEDSFVTSLNRCVRFINDEPMHGAEGQTVGDRERIKHFESALHHTEQLIELLRGRTLVTKDNTTLEPQKTLINLQDVELREAGLVLIYSPPDGRIEEFSLRGLGTEFKIDIL